MSFLFAILLTFSAMTSPELAKGVAEMTSPNGLAEIQGDTYYIEGRSIQIDVRKEVGEETYSFDEEGKMKKGLHKEDGGLRYYDDEGKQQTGFQNIEGKTYYFDKETGLAKVGVCEIEDTMYQFNDEGIMQTGVVGEYLYDSTGKRVSEGWHNGQYYNADGKLATGVTTIGEETYNLNNEGKPQQGYAENKYFDDEGKLVIGHTITSDDQYIKTDNNGTITYQTHKLAQKAVESAYSQLGIDQWCTDLVNNALRDAGLEPQGTYDWYQRIGHWVDNPKPGDIAMYKHAGGGWAHVALYVGEGMAVHGGYFTGGGKTTKIAPVNVGTSTLVGYIRIFGA